MGIIFASLGAAAALSVVAIAFSHGLSSDRQDQAGEGPLRVDELAGLPPEPEPKKEKASDPEKVDVPALAAQLDELASKVALPPQFRGMLPGLKGVAGKEVGAGAALDAIKALRDANNTPENKAAAAAQLVVYYLQSSKLKRMAIDKAVARFGGLPPGLLGPEALDAVRDFIAKAEAEAASGGDGSSSAKYSEVVKALDLLSRLGK